jgi:hypothetical protein
MTPTIAPNAPINLPVLLESRLLVQANSGGTLIKGARTIAPSSLDCAYAAGFFDGEGFVTIGFMSAKARTRGTTYTMRVGIAQNDPEPLLWVRDRWGGSVRLLKRRTDRGNLSYKWDCCSRMAAAFLDDVMPFLQVKKRRAEIAIAFQNSLFIPGSKGHTQEYRDRLEGFRFDLTGLNTHKPFKSGACA